MTRPTYKSQWGTGHHSKDETLPPQMLIPTNLYRKADGLKDPELK